jgi:predicted phage terminase large subunit-like protein
VYDLGLKDQWFFLLNVLRRRMAYADLKRVARELWQDCRPSVILIEDKASGIQLIKELIEEGVDVVERFKPEYDKVKRLDAQTATIENGLVYLPEQAGWLVDYIQEMITFPRSKYDDQVDSTSQALAWAKQRPAGWGVCEHMRRMVEKENGRAVGFPVTLKVPAGTTHVYTIDGRRHMVRPDLTIELNEEDAKPLLAAGFQKIGRRLPGITG